MPTLPEKTVERNDSTTSTIAVIDVPRLARRFHANHVYIRRQPDRHQSLPSELPYLQSQTLLTDDLADWIVPASAQSEKLKSTEWDSPTGLSSPSTAIVPSSVVAQEPVEILQTGKVEQEDGPLMPDDTEKLIPALTSNDGDEPAEPLSTSATESRDGTVTPDTVAPTHVLSSNNEAGSVKIPQELEMIPVNGPMTHSSIESTPGIPVNSDDNEYTEKPNNEQQNPSPVDSCQSAPLQKTTIDRDCAASIRSHASSILRKPLPATARVSPTVNITNSAAQTNASSPCQSSFFMVDSPSYNQAGLEVLFGRPSTDWPAVPSSESTQLQEQSGIGIGRGDAATHAEKEEGAHASSVSSIADSETTYPGCQFIANLETRSALSFAADKVTAEAKTNIESSESAQDIANHETSSTVPMPAEFPAKSARPNSSDAPIAVKPMSAQAKRRAAHQRRMELAFGGS
jgi:hypothetical protein